MAKPGPLIELIEGINRGELSMKVRRGWLKDDVPVGGISYIGPLHSQNYIKICKPQIIFLDRGEDIPDEDLGPEYDDFVLNYILPKKPRDANAFERGEIQCISLEDGPSAGDFESQIFQAIQFYQVNPDLLKRPIQAYGKRLDFTQKKYRNNSRAALSF